MVVPQFWQAITTVVFWFWSCKAAMSIGVGSFGLLAACALDAPWHFMTLKLALFETRLL
jgi:hypothetical protein